MHPIAKLAILSAAIAVHATGHSGSHTVALTTSSAATHTPSSVTSLPVSQTPPFPTVGDGCPTVLSTTDICSTCAQPMCLVLSTLTASCECPDTPATSTISYPCDGECPAGCPTSYTVVTASNCGYPVPSGSSETTTTSTGSGYPIPSGSAEPSTEPSTEPWESAPPPAASSGPVKAGAGKVGAFSVGGMAVVLGAYLVL